MAVTKKSRRAAHAKASRQQQQQQQQQQMSASMSSAAGRNTINNKIVNLSLSNPSFETNRLKPEPINSIVHDESDTISFRSFLLKNFIEMGNLMNALTCNITPLDKINAPEIFIPNEKGTNMESILKAMELKIDKDLEELEVLQNGKMQQEPFTPNDLTNFFSDKLKQLDNTTNVNDTQILQDYLSKKNLRSQENIIVIHRNEFNHLKQDPREAPQSYWDTYNANKIKLQQELEERKRLEEEEAKRRQEEEANFKLQQEEEEKRKKEEELQQQQQEEQQKLLLRQQQQQQDEEKQKQLAAQQAQQQQSQQQEQQEDGAEQQEQPAMLDNIFDDFTSNGNNNGNEFNTNFDDDFGDLDNVFF
ncbi:hypothetical protein NCAS_0C05810 [Naumovozyma castellii]|uniref:Uncharacterized protein n=1 Tax=Naumovozyma castellii TaxID=27288 RepID=G0VDK9_NAUCA|nr:hypothetical protein NCAS_0C05810 [Naumovozyma castellii CBS 4309]CCC69571.1 hypothetical protein NCAS_0C05810 [Naumovozyma castellii CBS 4309]